MVRCYVRKSQRGQYGSGTLSMALDEVRRGIALKSVAKKYGISPRTLRRHRDGKVINPGTVRLGNFTTLFTSQQEDILVEHVKTMERKHFGLTTKDIRKLAYSLAKQIGKSNKISDESNLVGYDWLHGFLKRHPELSIRSPESTSLSRVTGFNYAQVEKFYNIVKETLESQKASALNLWNMDETGISTVHKPCKILATKGARSVGKITSGERGKNITVICAFNAAGTFVPPAFIFPRKRIIPSLLNGAPAGSICFCSPSGWTDTEIFLQWLVHFSTFTNASLDNQQILLLDGHHSHKTLEAITYAREHGIIILTLPPHCTHKLQPLDLTFFKSLKSCYNSEAENWMLNHPGRKISFFEIASIFNAAYLRSADINKGISGFKAAGIWPFNPQKYGTNDFICVEKENIIESSLEPSTSMTNTETLSSNKENEFKISVTTFSPLPKFKLQQSKKRKPEQSLVITSSPYKKKLEERLKINKCKDTKYKSKNSLKKNNYVIDECSSTSKKKLEERLKISKCKDTKYKSENPLKKNHYEIHECCSTSIKNKTRNNIIESKWICKQCGVEWGHKNDPKRSEDWYSCTSCNNKYHHSCAWEDGIIDDDDEFVCKNCI